MANWDHKTNIGTHPVLSPDPRTRILAALEGAIFQRDRFQKVIDEMTRALEDLDELDRLERLASIQRKF